MTSETRWKRVNVIDLLLELNRAVPPGGLKLQEIVDLTCEIGLPFRTLTFLSEADGPVARVRYYRKPDNTTESRSYIRV